MKSIITEDLVKIYNKRKVVNNVSINLQQGEIVGILGPNGAGIVAIPEMFHRIRSG